MKKVTVVGAGHVGATTAQRLVEKEICDVVLIDIVEGLPQGKALDLMEAAPIEGHDSKIIGTNDYEDSKDSDLVVITAGIPRKPGMSRDDLVNVNAKIVRSVTEQLVKVSPDAIIVVVSNPLDVMCHVALETSGFPKHRVVGMAGMLDSARLRYFIADELNVSVKKTEALVLGGHGDSMVPLPTHCKVDGKSLTKLLPKEKVDALMTRTRDGGAEIVNLLKTGSAFYAPASAITEMVDSILNDRKKMLPCSAYLEGEYGLNDVFVGVPVKLGNNCIEEVVKLEIADDELQALHNSAATVEELKGLLK